MAKCRVAWKLVIEKHFLLLSSSVKSLGTCVLLIDEDTSFKRLDEAKLRLCNVLTKLPVG